jgi:hypothetical protein
MIFDAASKTEQRVGHIYVFRSIRTHIHAENMRSVQLLLLRWSIVQQYGTTGKDVRLYQF